MRVVKKYGKEAGRALLILLSVTVIGVAVYEGTVGHDTEEVVASALEQRPTEEIWDEIGSSPLNQGDIIVMKNGAVHLVRYKNEETLSVLVRNGDVRDINHSSAWYFDQVDRIVRKGELEYHLQIEKFGDP